MGIAPHRCAVDEPAGMLVAQVRAALPTCERREVRVPTLCVAPLDCRWGHQFALEFDDRLLLRLVKVRVRV